jgi:hypothetical protein
MSNSRELGRAIEKAQALLQVYDELKAWPGNETNLALDDERLWVQRWLNALLADPSPADIRAVWRDVQAIAKILDLWFSPEQLSRRKVAARSDLFEAMQALVSEIGESK